MKRVVWKYDLVPGDVVLEMPERSEVLHVHGQRGAGMLWALVDPERPKKPVRLRVVATGEPAEVSAGYYLGTFHQPDPLFGELVWHVFEVRS